MFDNPVGFARTVLGAYVVLLTGGTITAALGLIERRLGHNVSWPWYCVVLLLFVVIACYRAWVREHETAEATNYHGPQTDRS